MTIQSSANRLRGGYSRRNAFEAAPESDGPEFGRISDGPRLPCTRIESERVRQRANRLLYGSYLPVLYGVEVSIETFRRSLEHAPDNTRTRSTGLILLARSLARIADHDTHDCEEVFYLVEGAFIRHQGRRDQLTA